MLRKGYMGKILMVDLSGRTIHEEIIPEPVYDQYLAGMGLGVWMLYNRIPQNADPLGPDNMIGFLPGLLTGTGSLFSGRWMIVGKSPLTRGWGEANCGGSFSPAIKRCGYDGIFFKGISSEPVYLYIDDTTCELRDATSVWGKDTVETENRLLQTACHKKAKVACIGPAAEKLSLISGVSTDKGRMAARSGLGAVMGSKKLKALVLAGTRRITPHNPEEIKKLSRICNKWVRFQPPFVSGPITAFLGALLRIMPTVLTQDGMLYKIMLKKWGTVSMNQVSPEMGDSPIKNWKGTSRDWGFLKSISSNPDVFTSCEKVKFHCYSCPLGCGGICLTSGKYRETHKPEYETVLSLGGLCMNTDIDSIFHLNELLNRAGLDTISAGACVAFAMECFENGLITTRETDGVELSWGNSDAVIFLIEKMTRREGIGDLLADGVKIAARKLGRSAADFAIHAGGQEPGMHDSRNDPGFALHYSAEPAPGRHTNGAGLYYEMYQLWKTVKGIPKMPILYMKSSKYKPGVRHAQIAAANSKYLNIINCAGVCLFGAFLGSRRIRIFDWINAANGRHLSPEAYMAIGGDIQTLKQAFNVRHGIRPKDNIISHRALGRPCQEKGANKGRTVDIETMIHDYWKMFDWDTDTGIPNEKTLHEINREDQTEKILLGK